MEQIIIRVKDKDKAKALYDLLRALDFVDSIDTGSSRENESVQASEDEAFFSLAGIWSDRDITFNVKDFHFIPGLDLFEAEN